MAVRGCAAVCDVLMGHLVSCLWLHCNDDRFRFSVSLPRHITPLLPLSLLQQLPSPERCLFVPLCLSLSLSLSLSFSCLLLLLLHTTMMDCRYAPATAATNIYCVLMQLPFCGFLTSRSQTSSTDVCFALLVRERCTASTTA